MNIVSPALGRIALGLPEARIDHSLSQRWLAALSGVSAPSIGKVERGFCIDPALVLRLGIALVVLGAYRPPHFENDVDDLLTAATREPGERSAA